MLKNLVAAAGLWGPGMRGTIANNVTLTTAMTNLATAFQITTDIVVVATSGATGNTLALPKGAEVNDTITLVNNTANALSVVPATAAGKINALGAGAALATTASKHAEFVCLGGDNWAAVLSA